MSERPDTRRQPEGFCLMHYRDDAGNIEVIWNSRNAVTPFCISDRDGTREMMHFSDATHRDRYSPYHVPNVGDRIFVNLTLERAREHRRTYVERCWDEAKMSERWASKEEAVADLSVADYRSFGEGTTPDLIVVTQGVLNDLLSSREPFVMRRFA